MKRLSDILYRVPLLEVVGTTSLELDAITFDSRKVKPGHLFVAVRGTQADGHAFIPKALELGAVAVVCEQLPETLQEGVTYVRVADSSVALGWMADNFYDSPSSQLRIVAVTGTNGKTTIATLLYHLFRGFGEPCGLLSTIENKINEAVLPATHTTPDAVTLQSLLAAMVAAGCRYCFMEASSHAIHQHRLVGVRLAGAVFTNLTRDHLDYHETFDAYLAAKKKLFDELPEGAFALSNADDKRGLVMLQNTKATKYLYSLRTIADFHARILENSFEGLLLQLDGAEVNTRLAGDFNAYNLLAIYAVACLLGMDKMETLVGISKLSPAEGRFDYVISEKERITGIVDYAHTPDALEKVLHTLRSIRTGNETLFTVVGCGGDRDKGKRPLMARVAYEGSDLLLLTSDNPRSEDPEVILDDMKAGIPGYRASRVFAISDRREAIRLAVSMAKKGDIILLAGKGHEKYQEIKGVKNPFDDKAILAETFKTMNK